MGSRPSLLHSSIAGNSLLTGLIVLPKAAFGQSSAHGYTRFLAPSEFMLKILV